MPSDYMPKDMLLLCDWCENMKLEFPGLASPLGFSTQEITVILADLNWAMFDCKSASDAQTFATSWVQFRESHFFGDASQPTGSVPATMMPATPGVPAPAPGIIGRMRAVVKRIKASPAYTSAIGQTLRIVPNSAPVDPNTAQPDTKATALPMFKVKLRWTARGFAAVRTRCRREGETEWSDLGLATGNTIVDDRAPAEPGKPEVRTYEQIYVRFNQPVGQWSNSVRVTLQP